MLRLWEGDGAHWDRPLSLFLDQRGPERRCQGSFIPVVERHVYGRRWRRKLTLFPSKVGRDRLDRLYGNLAVRWRMQAETRVVCLLIGVVVDERMR